jgi:acetyl-CoA C-acetyltransferase
VSAFIVAALRTAVVPRGGAFRDLGIADLGGPLLSEMLARVGIAAGEVEELIVSNALGAGGNPARLVALAAGLPERVAGLSIDRQCAGGLDAVLIGRALVASGAADLVVAGGVESHSRRPLRAVPGPEGPLFYDRPPFTPWPDRDPDLAAAAADLAERLGISRAAQEGWAQGSHAKTLAARQDLRREIMPLLGVQDDVFARVLSTALLARAKIIAGSVTHATTAVAADAAAFVVIASERRARDFPGALRIAGGVTLGGAPEDPGLAPVAAIEKVLVAAGQRAEHLAMSEVMEAYAVQAMACVAAAGLDPARVNPGGGALARGHPIGASGAVLAVRLFHGLRQGFGLAAIAAAGGIGTALLVER